MKYIIELDEIPNTGLYKARGANTLVFDQRGIENILKPYEEEPEIDWSQVAVDTPILVKGLGTEDPWQPRHFAKYEDGKVYAWIGGCTSWSTTDDNVSFWAFAKVAEEGDSE